MKCVLVVVFLNLKWKVLVVRDCVDLGVSVKLEKIDFKIWTEILRFKIKF